MYISLNWLREYVDLPKKMDLAGLAELITIRSAEVEGIVNQGEAFEKMVIGKITKVKEHPDADKLRIVMVDVGGEKQVQIVCGGSNLEENMLVAVALPGAIVKWHGEEIIEMKVAKVRGMESHGMICAGEEIGLEAGGEKEIIDLSYLKTKPGTPLAKALGMDDTIIEFDNKALTHRPDLWGHRGIARELSAIMCMEFKDKKPRPALPRSGTSPRVKVKNLDLCRRYMAVIIKGVKVEESPEWLKRRLLATDHSIISNIVDATNYIMEEVGQPLHAFDLRKISGGITVRTAKKGEVMKTLDGEKRMLTEDMLLVADDKKALALAGVMGGEDSGIADDTVDILIESANFDPVSVRKTSVKLGLRTDSVQRFEKSLDPNQCEFAILRAVELILELCPSAKVAGAITDIASFETSEPLIPVNVATVNAKIGVHISPMDMADSLNKLGFEIQGKVKEDTKLFVVKVPSWRATKDVDIEDDIVEEIARMYGYENIPARVPDLPAKVPAQNIERKNKHDARGVLAKALGLMESYNYSFYGKQTIADFSLNEHEHLALKNTLSEEQSHMRTTLIPNLVGSLREATKFSKNPRLFEFGRVYLRKGKFMPDEQKHLAVAISLPKEENNSFSHIKGLLEQFAEIFNVEGLSIQKNETPADYMHPYQTASVILRGKNIGSIFTLHPLICEREDFDGKVACFELNFSSVSEARKLTKKYTAESKYPAIDFDISVLVDKKITVSELENAMKKSVPEILRRIELFDSYAGDKIETGKKSLAFRLTLQSNDRTLTGSDLENAQKSTWNALEKLGGKIRGK